MAKKKEPTMDMLAKELEDSFARWHTIHTKGCNDPFWSDGMNLNLVRNHILCYKLKIEALLTLEPKPPIYYEPTPMSRASALPLIIKHGANCLLSSSWAIWRYIPKNRCPEVMPCFLCQVYLSLSSGLTTAMVQATRNANFPRHLYPAKK